MQVIKLITTALSIILISWMLIHVLSIFGFFLALAYPLWWLLLPEKTYCLLCHAYPENKTCPFCKSPIDKKNQSPKTASSALKNTTLIFLLSFISLGLVIVETRALKYFGFPPTAKTAEFVIPPKGQYRLQEIFPMKIEIIGVETSINAVQADISFNPQKLQVVKISTQDSFAEIFIQKEIDNDRGFARLTGGLPDPGFFSDRGLFGTVYFQGIQPGIATVDFLPSSMVLANDGRGTNVIKQLSSVSYLILPEKLSPDELSQQSTLFENILGKTTDDNQLTFYTEPSVLGEQTTTKLEKPASKQQASSPQYIFLNLLARLNLFIVDFWDRSFQLIDF